MDDDFPLTPQERKVLIQDSIEKIHDIIAPRLKLDREMLINAVNNTDYAILVIADYGRSWLSVRQGVAHFSREDGEFLLGQFEWTEGIPLDWGEHRYIIDKRNRLDGFSFPIRDFFNDESDVFGAINIDI